MPPNKKKKASEERKRSDRPSTIEPGHLFLWHPDAVQYPQKMPTMGIYREGYPEGAIIHYTAGRASKGLVDAFGAMDWGIKKGYAFLTIANDGQIVQGHPFNEWGYHAGQSFWPSLGKSLSSKLIGIEICGAGKLEPQKDGTYKSWYGEKFTDKDVRFVGKDYGCEEGYYHRFTLEQEQALWGLLVFLKENDPKGRFKFENVLGHHEVTLSSDGSRRKIDPGGSLSIQMDLLRRALKFHREIDCLEDFGSWDM